MRGSGDAPRQSTVYQIDFAAVASGKRIAGTKRRVRWCVCGVICVCVCTARCAWLGNDPHTRLSR
jgi:hypothetical protein